MKLRKSLTLRYLVCWAGYAGTNKETLWLLATELGHASELIAGYHLKYPNKPGLYQAN